MQRNKNAPTPAEANEALVEQIRANVAFEHAVVSVLVGAGLCGVLKFAISFVLDLVAGAGLFNAIGAAGFSALVIMLLYFLIGFAAGAVVIAPLFRILEKSKRRSGGPYGAAALAVAGLALIIIGALPAAPGPTLSAVAAVILATIATSVLFARRMTPHWAAAEAEERAKDAAPVTFRLH